VSVKSDTFVVDLTDGRTLSVPIASYPRLAHGTESERMNWRLRGRTGFSAVHTFWESCNATRDMTLDAHS
jgi:hypothetical protein